jgi:hypothetical protein
VTMSKFRRLGLRWLAPVFGILALTMVSGRSVKTNKNTGPGDAALRSLLAAYGAENVTIDRTMRDFKTPQEFEWKTRPGSTSQTAALFGDPAKPGLYIQLLKRGPDDWSQPHSHPNERFITVLAGTMKIGTGAKFDKDQTVSLGPGSVIRDIANQTHYDGTGPEGLTIEIMGMGPATRN